MPSLKVLVLVSCFPPSRGGVEATAYRLASGLSERGHQVTVVTSSRGREPGYYVEKMGRMRVVRYPETRYFFEAPMVPRIALAALTEDYDVLHVHGMTPSVTDLGILFAKLRGRPVVLTYHNDSHLTRPGFAGRLAEKAYSKLSIPVVALADRIVGTTLSYPATSPVLKHFVRKMLIVPWGIDAARYEAGPPSSTWSVKRLLFVGQLKHYKGLDVLLRALSILKESGHHLETSIVGVGPAFRELSEQAKELKLDGAVRFLGEMPDEAMPKLYRECDVFVLPSMNRREAFGLVILEAFAAGKTVVASDIAGVREVAKLGDGLLCRPDDPESLAQAIVLATERPRAAGNAQLFCERFGWKKTIDRYEEILYSL